MQFKALLPLCFLLLTTFTQSFCQSDLFPIQKKKVFIEGIVSDYSSFKPKIGTLSFIDYVSGLKQKKEFIIDPNGGFRFEIDLHHIAYENAYFDFEKRFFPLTLNPGETYKISIDIKGKELTYLDGTGELSEEIEYVDQLIHKQYKTEFERINSLSREKLSVANSLKVVKDLEQKIMSFLDNYSKSKTISKEALNILKKEYKFKTASIWISFQYFYQKSEHEPNKELPSDFFIKLHNEYPIDSPNTYVSREYYFYLKKIGKILTTPKELNLDNKIDFYRSFNLFSEEGLQTIKRVFSGGRNFKMSEQDKTFFTNETTDNVIKLNKKFDVNNFLIAVRQFPKGIGRDLLISQFVSRVYFKTIFINPTNEEWKDIEYLVANKTILNELKQIALKRSNAAPDIPLNGESPSYKETPSVESLTKKYLDPHKGKVIYIDFWATWCGPCRREEPHAKKLHKEFEKDEVVFLNLCCQSKEQVWSSYVKEKNLHGENFLLTNDEFRLFAEMYNLKGFPSYILIDKEGEVKSMDAYWPSDSKRVIRQIDKLLR